MDMTPRLFRSVEHYLTEMGPLLADRILSERPFADEETLPHPALHDLKRVPLAAQLTTLMGCHHLLAESPFALLCCEMGTGKSFMSLATVYLDWVRDGRPNGRSWLIVAPPHLTRNWVREIFAALPDGTARVFLVNRLADGDPETDETLGCMEVTVEDDRVVPVRPRGNFSLQALRDRDTFHALTRGRKPTLCFWIGGRERMKLGPTWKTATATKPRLSKTYLEAPPREARFLRAFPDGGRLYWFVRDKRYYLFVPDGEGFAVYGSDSEGERVKLVNRLDGTVEQVIEGVGYRVVASPKSPAEFRDFYRGKTARSAVCPDSGEPLVKVPTKTKQFRAYAVPHTGDEAAGVDPEERLSALWQYNGKGLRRWPPGLYIARYLKGRFHGLVADELHEYNGSESAQGQMLSKLLGSVRKFIGLTGTLTNGSASSMWALCCRLAPHVMNALGMGPELREKGLMNFISTYGFLDTVIRKEPEDGRTTKKRETVQVRERPGIVPWLQTDPLTRRGPLLGATAFLELGDVGNLPPLIEEIVLVPPPEDLRKAAEAIEDDVRELFDSKETWALARKAVLQLLNILTIYTDRPFGWKKVYVDGEFVTEPENLDPGRLYPKEEKFIELCRREIAEGRKTIAYLHYVNFGIIERLIGMLRERGIKADYMSSLVAPTDRAEWFDKALGSGVDVAFCNPECVKTGLNLTRWNTIMFFQSGRNIITNCQAERRCLRIGAKRDVRVFWIAYDDTIQEATLTAMGQKKNALLGVQGRFSSEGLAALGTDVTQAVLKRLVEGGVTEKAADIWKRIREKTSGGQGIRREELRNLFVRLLMDDGAAPAQPPAKGQPLLWTLS